MLCEIAVKEKMVINASVNYSANHICPKGWYGVEDEYHWYVKVVDDERYKEIIRALSKICQVR